MKDGDFPTTVSIMERLLQVQVTELGARLLALGKEEMDRIGKLMIEEWNVGDLDLVWTIADSLGALVGKVINLLCIYVTIRRKRHFDDVPWRRLTNSPRTFGEFANHISCTPKRMVTLTSNTSFRSAIPTVPVPLPADVFDLLSAALSLEINHSSQKASSRCCLVDSLTIKLVSSGFFEFATAYPVAFTKLPSKSEFLRIGSNRVVPRLLGDLSWEVFAQVSQFGTLVSRPLTLSAIRALIITLVTRLLCGDSTLGAGEAHKLAGEIISISETTTGTGAIIARERTQITGLDVNVGEAMAVAAVWIVAHHELVQATTRGIVPSIEHMAKDFAFTQSNLETHPIGDIAAWLIYLSDTAPADSGIDGVLKRALEVWVYDVNSVPDGTQHVNWRAGMTIARMLAKDYEFGLHSSAKSRRKMAGCADVLIRAIECSEKKTLLQTQQMVDLAGAMKNVVEISVDEQGPKGTEESDASLKIDASRATHLALLEIGKSISSADCIGSLGLVAVLAELDGGDCSIDSYLVSRLLATLCEMSQEQVQKNRELFLAAITLIAKKFKASGSIDAKQMIEVLKSLAALMRESDTAQAPTLSGALVARIGDITRSIDAANRIHVEIDIENQIVMLDVWEAVCKALSQIHSKFIPAAFSALAAVTRLVGKELRQVMLDSLRFRSAVEEAAIATRLRKSQSEIKGTVGDMEHTRLAEHLEEEHLKWFDDLLALLSVEVSENSLEEIQSSLQSRSKFGPQEEPTSNEVRQRYSLLRENVRRSNGDTVDIYLST
ncbi:hypothetical protein HDU93_001469 [Gonapodya sp. JEL0774]|nr:hypothetical protein HDU93_001469 [Gonapodya sp. JEL0774]